MLLFDDLRWSPAINETVTTRNDAHNRHQRLLRQTLAANIMAQ